MYYLIILVIVYTLKHQISAMYNIIIQFQSMGSNKAAIVMSDSAAQRQLQKAAGSLQRGQPSCYLLYTSCQSKLFTGFLWNSHFD